MSGNFTLPESSMAFLVAWAGDRDLDVWGNDRMWRFGRDLIQGDGDHRDYAWRVEITKTGNCIAIINDGHLEALEFLGEYMAMIRRLGEQIVMPLGD